MKLFQIVAQLPQGWVVEPNGRNHKRTMTIKRERVELDPYEVGKSLIYQMRIAFCRFTHEQIEDIGRCSINRTHILVTKCDNKWVIVPCTSVTCKNGGYIVKGKQVIPLQHHKQGTLEEIISDYKRAYDSRKDNVRIDRLSAEGLCNAFRGNRTHKGKRRGQYGFEEYKSSTQCKTEETSRPWKRGERVHLRHENEKKREANRREQNALNIIRVAKVGLIYKSNTKAVHYKQQF